MARLRYNSLGTGSAGSTVSLSLGASLTNSATSVTFNAALTYRNGTAVPTIGGSDYIPLEILDANGRLSEIVYLTAYTAAATTGTIVRGMEGTAGVAHSSGDKIDHGPTVVDVQADPPPNAPNAKDDEFDGSSSASWSSTPTAPTSWDVNGTRPSHAALRSNGNGNNVVGKYQSVPSFPFTVTAKIAGHNSHGASNRVGIFLAPASPSGASANLLLATEVAAGSHYWQRILQSAMTGAFVSSNVGLQVPVSSGSWRDFSGPSYLRLTVNSATSVDAALSRDGWNFVTFESALNPGFTPGVMGVFVAELGTADLSAHFDFFRVT